jgi:ABC-type bacteriocin/lantibiotic exporter with double-glycine peptidase domain
LATAYGNLNAFRSNSLGNFSALLPQVLGILTVIALVMIQIKNQPLIGVAFLSFLYLFLRLVQTLSSLATAYGNLNAYSQSYFLIENYVGQFSKEDLTEALKPADLVSSVGLRRKLHFFEQTASKESHAKSSRALPQRPPQIQFVDVDFRYSSDGPWILRNFNLVIQSGEACAIMGASGSGKSTLLALVLGLLEPTGGKVLIDEMEPKIYFSKYSQTLGFVGSEPYIVEGTVRENLQYGSSNFAATDDELLQSLKRAQLQDLLDQNSKILDYPLTENGEGLSTGQKQRLMFARGMLAHPKLLLLDEASANLDELTESALTNEIKKLYGQCTVLAISHRPAFVNWMNHIQRLNTESSSRGLSL